MRLGIILSCGLMIAAPALAHKEDSVDTGKDPNKVVCKVQDVTGSRLQTQKQCMTVAQWAQQRQEQDEAIGRLQGGGGPQGH